MKTYDKKNNDTYIEQYSNSMVGDVEAHMFKDDSIGRTMKHGVYGNFHSESGNIARNYVLQFETPTTLGLKGLKALDFKTLIPYSLMKKYDIHFLDCEYVQKTPVYFNVETEKFVLALDHRIMRDLGNNDYFNNAIQSFIDNGEILLKDINGNLQLLLNYESLDDLRKDTTETFKKLKEIYMNSIMDYYPTEDVIIVLYSIISNSENYLNTPHRFNQKHDNPHEYENSSISFEYMKAKKIKENYFFMYDKNGELIKNQKFYCDKNKTWDKNNNNKLINSAWLLGVTPSALIIPYTQLDWDLLSNLKIKMNSIFSDLDNLLLTQKTEDGLDGSLQNININEHILLSNNTSNKQIKLGR